MSFFKTCPCCSKWRVHITKRTYKVPKVSTIPITSQNELCLQCYLGIKKHVIKNI